MSAWETARLGDVVDIFDHKRVPLSSAQRTTRKGPFPYYGAQGVIDHIDDFIFDGRFILVPEDGENLRSRKLPIAYFAEGQFWVNNHAHIIKAKPGLAVDRFVQSAIEATSIGAWVTGAAQPKLSQANLREIPVLLPSYRDQQLISSILDAFDDLIENNRRRVEVLEEMARTIYCEWFVHFRYPGHESTTLVETDVRAIPQDWAVGTIGSLGTVVTGATPSPSEAAYWGSAGETPFLTPSEMSMDRLWAQPARFLSDDGVSSVRKRLLPAGAVCFVCIGATIGKIAVTVRPTVTNQQVNSLIVDETVSTAAYAFHALNGVVDVVRSAAGGAATPIINKSAFSAIEITVPQVAIAQAFGRAVDPLHQAVVTLERQNDVLAIQRDIVLPKLVTGQIDVSTLDLDALVDGSVA